MTQELVLLTAFACALSAGLLYDLISTAYRSLMAPQIRRALNACHDEIEFAKLNHVASSPSASLQKLSQANSAFQMAKRSLDAGHYKLCLTALYLHRTICSGWANNCAHWAILPPVLQALGP